MAHGPREQLSLRVHCAAFRPGIGSSRAAMGKQRPWGRRPTPPGALDWSIQGTRGEASHDWIIPGSKAQAWIIQGCQGEAKA